MSIAAFIFSGRPYCAWRKLAACLGACGVLSCVGSLAITSTRSNPLSEQGEHWAFQPVTRPTPPVLPASSPVRNPIDAFILARQFEAGLTPSPPADRVTLIRRLFFDVTGLPPTPEQVASFVSDTGPGAYEKRVDELLDSPRFGECWARHWLDVVRFSETHGFEMNNPRPNAWPYRDYVIRSFNDDKPYNQFILEQIAGDALGVDEGTGFLVAGPWDQVKSPDEVLTKNQRADELHDMVSTTGSAFLGLTIGCARCHDHKFDPIPQRDYYAIKAIFEGVQHGERPRKDPDRDRRLADAAQRKNRVAEIESELSVFEPLAQVGPMIDTNRLRAPVNARLNVERFDPVAARRLRFSILATTSLEPCIDELEVYAVEEANPSLSSAAPDAAPPAVRKPHLRNVALADLGTRARASGTYPNSDLHRLEHINDGKYGNSRSWISDATGQGWVELEFPETVTICRVVWGRDREEKFKDRLATDYRVEVAQATNEWRLVASSADRQSYRSDQKFELDYRTNELAPSVLARFDEWRRELQEQQHKIKQLTAVPRVYAGDFREPESTHRFNRGDPMQPREIVAPGALSVIATAEVCGPLSTNTPEAERRLAFARWIASTNNPLTARVIVNRLWQYHFGEGLVSTPSDFGRNGAKPSHPELLDWLAAELMAPTFDGRTQQIRAPDAAFRDPQPWSLKHLHRLILTSATYQQASVPRREAMRLDASTRLLWRFPPRRLDAEPLRDAMLAAVGKLDLRMGGPGWSPFEPNENYVRVYVPKKEFGPEDFRRMIYATAVRQRTDGVFGVFDCPDGGQIAPKRTRSTTPLQALNLLNSGFIMQVAGFFAERLERDVGPEPEAQVRRAFALAFNRQPDSAELESATRLIHEDGLKVFCRAIFNANEFAYVF